MLINEKNNRQTKVYEEKKTSYRTIDELLVRIINLSQV